MESIADIGRACLSSFAKLIAALPEASEEYSTCIPPDQLELDFGRFKVWCGNLGALQSGQSSLDSRLRDSTVMRVNISKHLTRLNQTITMSLEVASGSRPGFERAQYSLSSSDESSSEESENGDEVRNELALHMATIKTIINDLYILSTRIRNTSTRPSSNLRSILYREIDTDTGIDKFSAYSEFDKRHVEESLLQLRKDAAMQMSIDCSEIAQLTISDQYLINRLVSTMNKRRRILRYWQRHARKLAEVPSEFVEDVRPQITLPLHGMKTGTPSVLEVSNAPAPTVVQSITEKTILSATEATRFDSRLDEVFDAQSTISYASTTVDIPGIDIDLPAPPMAALEGSEFQCPYCGIVCPARHGKDRAWVAHIIQDLQPYICTYERCDNGDHLYSSRTAWLEHERLSHRRVWQCFDHTEPNFSSKAALKHHLESEHGKDVTELQIQNLVEISVSSIAETRSACPFCKMQGPFVKGFETHMISHMHNYAVFSVSRDILPSAGDDDNEEHIQSAHAQGLGSQDLELSESLQFDSQPPSDAGSVADALTLQRSTSPDWDKDLAYEDKLVNDIPRASSTVDTHFADLEEESIPALFDAQARRASFSAQFSRSDIKDMKFDHRDVQSKRLVIGIDYGTTYTGVAVATPTTDTVALSDIEIINDWGHQMDNSDKVPSIISYSPSTSADGEDFLQWGSSLSPDATVIANIKLQLDIQDVSAELKSLRATLEAMDNLSFKYITTSEEYLGNVWKNPGAILTDYLSCIFGSLKRQKSLMAPEVRMVAPVDICATIPMEWSYLAINTMYRALTRAGFNTKEFPRLRNFMLVTQEHAAATFTMRCMKEMMGQDVLRIGDVFVLCDAGAITVDAASFRVQSLEPLELKSIGRATGGKCGSMYINLNFKRWLRALMGDERYRQLDSNPTSEIISHYREGCGMQKLMGAFEELKKSFRADSHDFYMDMPKPFEHLNCRREIKEGEITMTNSLMKQFFDPCVDGTIGLIRDQIRYIEQQGYRLKNLCLVGGFAESRYLQNEIRFSMRIRNVKMHLPDNIWTAVVRGAILVSGTTNQQNLIKVTPCPRSYGTVLVQEYSAVEPHGIDSRSGSELGSMQARQIRWLIREGDAVLSNQSRRIRENFVVHFKASSSRQGRVPIYAYHGEDVPTRFENAKAELEEVAVLAYNLGGFALTEFERPLQSKGQITTYSATLTIELILQTNALEKDKLFLEIALYFKDRALHRIEMII